MNERLKLLRKELGYTQQKFADKIHVSRNNVAGYETDTRKPSDAVITLICREFNVREQWLRTGEGEMFVHSTREEELAIKLGHIMRDEDESLRRSVLAAIINMDKKGFESMMGFLKSVIDNSEFPT